MRRLIASLGAAAALVVGSGVVTATPAQAASLYEHINRDNDGDIFWHETCGGITHYPEWFWDKTSSWYNNGTPAEAWDYSGSGGIFWVLWYMPANTYSNWVGDADNDRADTGYDYCG